MKQIYRFDDTAPPPLSEKSLRTEIERRKLRRQTVLLALAGNLSVLCMIAAAFLLLPVSIIVSVSCIAYACVAICGGTAIAIVFIDKRRNLECPQPHHSL